MRIEKSPVLLTQSVFLLHLQTRPPRAKGSRKTTRPLIHSSKRKKPPSGRMLHPERCCTRPRKKPDDKSPIYLSTYFQSTIPKAKFPGGNRTSRTSNSASRDIVLEWLKNPAILPVPWIIDGVVEVTRSESDGCGGCCGCWFWWFSGGDGRGCRESGMLLYVLGSFAWSDWLDAASPMVRVGCG